MDRNSFTNVESKADKFQELQQNITYATISKDDLPRHMLVIGTSGMGKTKVCLELIKSIQNIKENKEK